MGFTYLNPRYYSPTVDLYCDRQHFMCKCFMSVQGMVPKDKLFAARYKSYGQLNKDSVRYIDTVLQNSSFLVSGILKFYSPQVFVA